MPPNTRTVFYGPGGISPRYAYAYYYRLYPRLLTSDYNCPKCIPSPVEEPFAIFVIFCELSDTEPVGIGRLLSVVVLGWILVVIYPRVAISVDTIGVARLVICCELSDTDAVGAVIVLRAAVLAYRFEVAYPWLAQSVLSVGVAKLVIFVN